MLRKEKLVKESGGFIYSKEKFIIFTSISIQPKPRSHRHTNIGFLCRHTFSANPPKGRISTQIKTKNRYKTNYELWRLETWMVDKRLIDNPRKQIIMKISTNAFCFRGKEPGERRTTHFSHKLNQVQIHNENAFDASSTFTSSSPTWNKQLNNVWV